MLFTVLGGEVGIRRILERLYARASTDALLAPFLRETNIESLIIRQQAFIGQATGGPQAYKGPSLAQAHAHLQIEEPHFSAFVFQLGRALDDLGFPQQTIDEVLARVIPLEKVIVNTRAPVLQNNGSR